MDRVYAGKILNINAVLAGRNSRPSRRMTIAMWSFSSPN